MIDNHPTPRDHQVSGWHKTTYSAPDQSCVEVNHTDTAVGVRDTKNRTAGALAFRHEAWIRFLSQFTRS